MTPERRRDLLVRAKILDGTGHYHPDYFSAETVAKDRADTERKRLADAVGMPVAAGPEPGPHPAPL